MLMLAACGGDRPRPAPNVIVISLDTLRADRIPTYGYARSTAPRIDAFARQAVVFDRCYSEASHTLLAHATLLTGVYPETHGVVAFESSLPEEFPTMAQVLRERGYRTAAFLNCGFFEAKFKLDRGFDTYDYFHDRQASGLTDQGSWGRSAGQTNRAVFQWLGETPSEPFFLFVHYYDVHSDWESLPYEAPPGFRERFEITRPPGFKSGDGEVSASLYLLRMNERDIEYGESERAYLGSLYDGGIAYTDSEVGALLDRLRDLRVLERSIVVVTSDHGEEFQEHGKLLHSQVYQELVHVPLVLAFPEGGFSGKRVASPVQLGDVMPTVLDYLGLEPPQTVQGRSLLPLVAHDESPRRFAYFRNEDGTQYGLSDGRWKLVLHGRENPVARLFDLDADPGEVRDVAEIETDRVLELRAALEKWRSETLELRPDLPRDTDLDEQTLDQLEALGYVGGDRE
jgi:arylsulfatase A-like enzyme